MEGEGRHHEHEEVQKSKEQQIIDNLPDDIRHDLDVLAELDPDALKEYLAKAEKLANLARELDSPGAHDWFQFEGNDVYKRKQREAGVEKQFTKLVPPYPSLDHRGHDVASLLHAARILYTHGIGEEGPLNLRDVQFFLNLALNNYGLEVIQSQTPPTGVVYPDVSVVEPLSEEDEKKIVDFPRSRGFEEENQSFQEGKEGTILPFTHHEHKQDDSTPKE